jgi:hypothetical protein
MRTVAAVYITLGTCLTLGAGPAAAQVPTTEPQPRLAVPTRGTVIQTTAPTETAAPTTQTPGQPTTSEPAPVTAVTPPSGVTTIPTTPQPTASSSQAVIATRSYVASKFALTLGGVQIGSLYSAAGGDAFGQVVTEKVGPDNIALKHLGGVAYEPITVVTDFHSKALMNWIAESWKGKYTRQSGSILEIDYDYNIRGEKEFFNAIIAETTLPALDAAAKDPARITVKLAPEYTRLKAGSGTKAGTSTEKTSARWLPSNFRFEMTGLDGSKVNKIDAITVRQTVTENAVGELRDYQKEPSAIDFPNLKITLASSSAQSWAAWHEDFVIKGNSEASKERSGAIVYLDPYMKTEYGRLNLSNCGIFKLSQEPVVAGAESISRMVAELYCERMELVPNSKAF